MKPGFVKYKRFEYSNTFVLAYFVGTNSKGEPVLQNSEEEYFVAKWENMKAIDKNENTKELFNNWVGR